MELNRRFLFILLVFFVCTSSFAEVNRYIVYFPDKSDNNFSIDEPLNFLSQRALDRRLKGNVSITLDDLPVSQKYIDSLSKYNVKAHFLTKWFNAALIEVDEAVANDLATKSFTMGVELVAPGAQYDPVPSQENLIRDEKLPEASSLNTNTQLNMLQANVMHQEGYKGSGIWIAVFDDGFQGVNESAVFKHLYDNGRIKDTQDIIAGGRDVYKYDDHGTRVLSCISADFNDQIVGTAYEADLSLYVTGDDAVFEDEFRIEEFNWVIAAEKADSAGVDIISSSLGYNEFEDPTMDYTIDDLDGSTAVVTQGAQMASDRGILVVNSAGNSGNDSWGLIVFPSDAEGVLSVGSVTTVGSVSSFSSRGPTADDRIKPDVVALGSSAVIVNRDGNIQSNNGTSFSCPLVSGLAAGIWQSLPELTNHQLMDVIRNSGSRKDNPNNSLGYGIPNYLDAENAILSVEKLKENRLIVYPNPIDNSIFNLVIQDSDFIRNPMITIYNAQGQQIFVKSKLTSNAQNSYTFDMSGHPAGLYNLMVIGEQIQSSIKILKR